jgi:hypothetical protein
MPRRIVSLDARDRVARRATSNGSEQGVQSAGPALHRRAAAGSSFVTNEQVERTQRQRHAEPEHGSAATALSHSSWRDTGRTRTAPIAAQHVSIANRSAIASGRTDKTSPRRCEMIDRQEGELFRQSASFPPA